MSVPIVLLVAAFAFIGWHAPLSPPESRPIAAIYKLLNHLRTDKIQPIRENKIATVIPETPATARPKPTAGVDTASRTAKVNQSRRAASLQLEQPLTSEHPKVRDEVIHPDQLSDDATTVVLQAGGTVDDPDALVNLANVYLTGDGVPRNCDRATAMLRFAAGKQNVRARNHLAAMYATGSCVKRDRVEAYRWLTSTLAIKPDDTYARQNRNLTWQQMTPEERNIVELQR